jgi:putative ABC transport system ATP-binding protein
MPIIETKQLVKTFSRGEVETQVLRGIDLQILRSEWAAIMGRSGAGKSTLMYQISLLDAPTGGEILIDGKSTQLMSEREKAQIRLRKFGFVFQDYALMPELTAVENIILPLLMSEHPIGRATTMAEAALSRVGLSHRYYNLPSQLSGGEQQRVSIARAIAETPEVLFADEPTANLDRESANMVIDLFADLHRSGQTIIMVTHEKEYGNRAERILTLDDGRIVDAVR